MRIGSFVAVVALVCQAAAVTLAAAPAGTGKAGGFVNSLGTRLVPVPAGEFVMGEGKTPPGTKDEWLGRDWDESPAHTVRIMRAFHVGAFEVTNAQYERFDPAHKALRGRGGPSEADDEPVTMVTWRQAADFCAWLSKAEGKPYRLPTEAEWEYACRAGTATAFHTGDTITAKQANFGRAADGEAAITTRPVGSYPANGWGLHDTHGNVAEWCADWFGPYEPGEQADPVGRAAGDARVCRGWSYLPVSHERGASRYGRSANRSGHLSADANAATGFRVVCGELPPTKPLPAPAPPRHQRDVRQAPPAPPAGHDADEPYFVDFSEGQRHPVLPEDAWGPVFAAHNHFTAACVCPNGDVLAVWYSTVHEEGRECAQAASRLRAGSAQWDEPSFFFGVPDVNTHAPVLLSDGKRVYHFCTQSLAGWDDAADVMRVSDDSGATWSEPRIILHRGHERRMSQPCSAFVARDGTLVLAVDGDFGHRDERVLTSADGGRTWRVGEGDLVKAAGKYAIHPAVVQRDDGAYLAFLRGPDPMPAFVSKDAGESWQPADPAVPFPGISVGQKAAALKLAGGALLLASFDNKGKLVPGRDGGGGAFVALSPDDGRTWSHVRKVERMGIGGYLSLAQRGDGVVYLVNPAGRAIHCVAFNEAWVREDEAPAAAAGADAGAEPQAYPLPPVDLRENPVLWGSTCEAPCGLALSFGGQDQHGDDGNPRTRVRVAGEWKAIHADLRAANPLQKYHDHCRGLARRQKDLAARARSLYFEGRSTDEERARVERELLPAQRELDEATAKLSSDLRSAAKGFGDYERGQAGRVVARLARVGAGGGDNSPQRLLSAGRLARAVRAMGETQAGLEKATESMDAEPPGRALSPLVYDGRTKLFVLFGGDHLDYLTNDTWVFDPAKRQWRQRHPPHAPPARADHSLRASGDGTITLAGGYAYTSSTDYCGAQYQAAGGGEWVYDLAADAWRAQALDAAPAPPDSRVYRTGPFHPDFFLRGDRPDAAATARLIESAPANAWVEMKPPHRPELDRCWGTAVLDVHRDQILVWGGGHSAHGGSDVLHYHLATNGWELPFPVEFPLGQLYNNTEYPDGFNLNRRPWVTGHTYQSYGYDPQSRAMYFTGRQSHCYVYDPDAADWSGRFVKPEGMTYGDSFYTLTLCPTPAGLMCWTEHGRVFRLDAAGRQWVEFPLNGAELAGSVVDSSTMVYDSRRGRLLMFRGEYGKPFRGEAYSLDLKSGTVAAVEPANNAALVELGLAEVARACYEPAADLVLLSALLPPGDDASGPRRTLAYDCAAQRWAGVAVGYERDGEGKASTPLEPSHSCGLTYDAGRKLVWGVSTLERRVYLLRLDRGSADVRALR